MSSSHISQLVRYLSLVIALMFTFTGSSQNCSCLNDSIPPTGTAPNGQTNASACTVQDSAEAAVPFDPAAAVANFSDNCSNLENLTAILIGTSFQLTGVCNWRLIYTYSVSDSCGNTSHNVEITHEGNNSTPPTFDNCPSDITVNSPNDIPFPENVDFTSCSGVTGTVSVLDHSQFQEEFFGLLDEPGYCPDSIHRYYIAEDECNNRDTCFQRIIIDNMGECELCQDTVNYYPIDLSENPDDTIFVICVDRYGLCCDASWPDRCVAFSVEVPSGAVGLQIITESGAGNCNPEGNGINNGDWYVDCGLQAEFEDNVLCLEGKTTFTLIHCRPGGDSKHYLFNIFLIIELGPDTLEVLGDTILDAGAGWASYLWSTGETTQTIEVTSSGTYSVTVTESDHGCEASDVVFVDIVTDLLDISNTENISIYPNPNRGSFRISIDLPKEETIRASVMNVFGQTVWDSNPERVSGRKMIDVDLGNSPPGIYFVRIDYKGAGYIGKILVY